MESLGTNWRLEEVMEKLGKGWRELERPKAKALVRIHFFLQ
jgi:hypothetical protein